MENYKYRNALRELENCLNSLNEPIYDKEEIRARTKIIQICSLIIMDAEGIEEINGCEKMLTGN